MMIGAIAYAVMKKTMKDRYLPSDHHIVGQAHCLCCGRELEDGQVIIPFESPEVTRIYYGGLW